MAIILALPHLFDAVVAQFAADGTNVPQSFGWLAPAQQMTTTARIVWIPGDVAGNLGGLGAPKYPGQNPRQLATLLELCTVEITAFDRSEYTDERKQYQIARELYDAWYRAAYLKAHGTFLIVSSAWVGGDRARRMGATIRVVFSIQAPITDVPITVAATDTGALITVDELDKSESFEVSPS